MTIAIAVTAGVIVLILCITAWFRRSVEDDLGVVSTTWVAEQKFGPGGDSRR